jgi:hypothetical protein
MRVPTPAGDTPPDKAAASGDTECDRAERKAEVAGGHRMLFWVFDEFDQTLGLALCVQRP